MNITKLLPEEKKLCVKAFDCNPLACVKKNEDNQKWSIKRKNFPKKLNSNKNMMDRERESLLLNV